MATHGEMAPGHQRADLGRLQRMEDLGVQVGVDRLSVAVEVENQRPLAFEHSLKNMKSLEL